MKADLKSDRLFSIISMGGVAGLTDILFLSAIATLLFQNSLPEYIPALTMIFFISGAFANLLLALFSEYEGTINSIQDSPAAILSITIANITSAMTAYAKTEIFYTALAAIALTTVLTGLILFFLGFFKLGNLVRFMPYPVIGGFMAGTGWLLFTAGIGILVNRAFNMQLLAQLLSPDLILKWLPLTLMALGLIIAQRRINHPVLLPVSLLVLTVIFYVFLLISGTSISEAVQQGYLLKVSSKEAAFNPLTADTLAMVKWDQVFSNAGTIATAIFTSIAAVMLTITSIEASIRRPLDVNKELQTIGAANIFTSFFSSSVSYPTLSLSLMGKKINVESRIISIVTSIIHLTAFIIGVKLLQFIPVPVIGLSIIMFGLFFLVEWLWDGLFNLTKADYILVVIILGVIAFSGFIEGVLVGIVLTIILTVINYSQVNIVWHESIGTKIKSNVQRASRYQIVLKELGNQLHVFRLRGFLFFGTANQLLQNLRARLEDTNNPPLKYVILDFKQINQIDSSALNNLALVSFMAESYDFWLLFSDVAKAQMKRFNNIDFKKNSKVRFFESLDFAVEWCEDKILTSQSRGNTQQRQSLKKYLKEDFPDFSDLDTLLGYTKMINYSIGDKLIQQGSPPDALYIVESGQVEVHIEGEENQLRVQAMGEGTLVGELQVYLNQPASASVIVTLPSTIYKFSIKSLKKLEKEHPDLASEFHRYIVRILGNRLLTNNFILKEYV